MSKVLIDTNVLLEGFQIEEGNTYVLLSHVNRELEKHKTYGNEDLKFKARQAVRFIEDNKENFYFDIKDYKVSFEKEADDQYTDNKIVQACIDNTYKLMTNDVFLRHKAEAYGIELVAHREETEDDYCGYKTIVPSDNELADIYEFPHNNTYELLVNQYLVIKDAQGNEVDCFKWNGNKYIAITKTKYELDTIALGKFKCLDIYQRAAVDSLQNNDITALRGKAGSGKSLIALTYAMRQLEKGKATKLIIFVPNVPVMNSREIGWYKGTKDEKLLQGSIGSLLSSKLGNKEQVEKMIALGVLELLPLSDIRGFETPENSILWISESQNLDINLMKLTIQRLGKNCKLIIDGDDKAQVDDKAFAGSRNGMKRMSKVFRGEDLYGEVELAKIYRSKAAEIADKM